MQLMSSHPKKEKPTKLRSECKCVWDLKLRSQVFLTCVINAKTETVVISLHLGMILSICGNRKIDSFAYAAMNYHCSFVHTDNRIK